MDRWDVMAVVGALLVGVGVHDLVGGAWMLILWGVMLLALPVIRQLRTERAKRAK